MNKWDKTVFFLLDWSTQTHSLAASALALQICERFSLLQNGNRFNCSSWSGLWSFTRPPSSRRGSNHHRHGAWRNSTAVLGSLEIRTTPVDQICELGHRGALIDYSWQILFKQKSQKMPSLQSQTVSRRHFLHQLQCKHIPPLISYPHSLR